MKIKKDIQRLARRLFRLCFIDSRLDEDRFRNLIRQLSVKKPRNYPAILRALHILLQLEETRHQVTVTSAYPLPDEEAAQIKTKITTLHGDHLNYQWNVDSSLIAGLKIQIADKVYDGTILNRLTRFQSLSLH